MLDIQKNIIPHFMTIISEKKKYWITLLLLLLCIVIFLSNYNYLDAYLPRNLSGIYYYLNDLFGVTGTPDGFAIYYLLGSMSCLLLNISPEVFLWVQPGALLTPLMIFAIFYSLSKKPFFSVLMTYVYSFVATNPNSYYFFAHLPGSLIYYTILLGLIICLCRKNIDYRAIVLGTILVIALNFASYNSMMRLLLVLTFLLLFLVVKYIIEKKYKTFDNKTAIIIRNITTLLITSVIIYAIAEVFINVLLPYLGKQGNVGVSPIDLIYQSFLGPLLGTDNHASIYSDVLFYSSTWGSIFGVVKYLIAGIIILSYLLYIFKIEILKKHRLQFLDCLCLALLFSTGLYFLARAIASSFQLELIHFPAVIIFVRLISCFVLNSKYLKQDSHSNSKSHTNIGKFGKIIIILLVIYSICSIIPYISEYSVDSGIENNDGYKMYSTHPQQISSLSWFDNQIQSNPSILLDVSTDHYTRGVAMLYQLSHNRIISMENIADSYSIISLNDIQNLIYNRDVGAGFIIQNMNIPFLAVGTHFEVAKAWSNMEDKYDSNENYNKIYSNEGMNILAER